MTLRQKVKAKISALDDEIKQCKIDYCTAKSWTSRYAAEEKITKIQEDINLLKELL